MEAKRLELFQHSRYLMAHIQMIASSVQNPLTPEQIALEALTKENEAIVKEINDWVEDIKNYYDELAKDEAAIAEIEAQQAMNMPHV